MTESRGSKHIILCDNCGKTFRHEESYKNHREQPYTKPLTYQRYVNSL